MKYIFLLSFFVMGVHAQEVTLPLEKYDALREKARPLQEPETKPPVPFSVEEVFARVEVNAIRARVSQEITIFVFEKSWQKIPLPKSGSFVKADFGNLEGRVVIDSEWYLHVRGKGRHTIRLESMVNVDRDQNTTRETWSLEMVLPKAARARGELIAPAAIKEIQSSKGLILGPSAANGVWTFVAQPDWLLKATFLGPAADDGKTLLPPRFQAVSATAVSARTTRLEAYAFVGVTLSQGQLTEMRMPIPEGFEPVSVTGAPDADWERDGEALLIKPITPVKERFDLEIKLVASPRNTFEAPVLLPENAARISVYVSATADEEGLLRLKASGSGKTSRGNGLLPKAFQELGGYTLAVADPENLPVWEVIWPERTDVLTAKVDRITLDVLVGANGRAGYRLWALIRNTGQAFMPVAMPTGFELIHAEINGYEAKPGRSGENLMIPLHGTRAEQVVYLSGVIPLALPSGDGEIAIAPPAFSAPVGKIEIRVQLPDDYESTLADLRRTGRISKLPARRKSADSSSMIADRVFLASEPEWSPRTWSLFPNAPGAQSLEASWNTLAPVPEPLIIKLEATKIKKEWL